MIFHGRPAELMQACSVAANVFVYNLLLLWLYSIIIDLDRVSVIQFYDTDHARMKSNQIKSNQIKSKSNQIKSNKIKSNQIKSNEIKSNQTKPSKISGLLTFILKGEHRPDNFTVQKLIR